MRLFGGTPKAKERSNLDEPSLTDIISQKSQGAAFMSHGSITLKDVDASSDEVAQGVVDWHTGGFTEVKTLQDAVRNHGRVDLMSKEGKSYAVKRMPTRWVRTTPADFLAQYPTASEKPWADIGLLRLLNNLEYPYVCQLHGVFRSKDETFVVYTFCTGGDLFSWCDRDSVPKPGKEREAVVLPIVSQVFSGIRWLHELGIAHRDVSLENILLTEDAAGESVRIIDFGMATLARTARKEVRGKVSYQAPEMHGEADFDTFLADEFAVGVVLFAMVAQDYPWTSTKPGACKLFEFISQFGFRRFLEKRKVRKGKGEFLAEVLTPEVIDVCEGLLRMAPKDRAYLGESCFKQDAQVPIPSNARNAGEQRRLNVMECKFFAGTPQALAP